jgi:hypothetical protein
MYKLGSVSVAGLTSENKPKLNQDYAVCKETSSGYAAVISDGAGSAIYGGIGSKCVSRTVIKALQKQHILIDVDSFSELVFNAVEKSLKILRRLSRLYRLDAQITAFSATLVVAYQTGDKCYCAHLGDGTCMFFNDANELIKISLPENGEYINETFFVSNKDWANNLRCFEFTENKTNCLVMSDGVTPFALLNDAPFLEFTKPMLNFLRTATLDEATEAITTMLTSQKATGISSDDKSLAWWITC